MKIYNLGVIGCGNMSQAILKALVKSENRDIMQKNGYELGLNVSDTDAEKLDVMHKLGVKIFTDNDEMIKKCDYILLAIKPQVARQVLETFDFGNKIVISIMAGINLLTLNKITKCDKLARVMPNLNAKIGESFNAYCTQNLNDEQTNFIQLLLSSFGRAVKLEENMFNGVTGLTGSSPAFVFMFLKSFIDQGIASGFSPIVARQMAVAAIIGSVRLVESEPNTDINLLIDSVCSKGGTTIEGVNFLRENNFEDTVKNAIEKAIKRSEELSKN